MLDLDIEKFWEDDKTAHDENCFSKNSKQVAMGVLMSDECVFAELGEEGQPWGITPADRRLDLNKRYNEKALKIVGRKLLSETPPAPADSHLPMLKQIGEIFGGRYIFDGQTVWLEGSLKDEFDLEKKLDEVYITVNKNAIPNDPEKPFVTSGIRVGTPAVTSRGFKEADMEVIGKLIKMTATEFDTKADYIREQVTALVKEHPLYF